MAVIGRAGGDNQFFDVHTVRSFDELVPHLESVTAQATQLAAQARSSGPSKDLAMEAVAARDRFFELGRRFDALEAQIDTVTDDRFLATSGLARTALSSAQQAVAKMQRDVGRDYVAAAMEARAAALQRDQRLADLLGLPVAFVRQHRPKE